MLSRAAQYGNRRNESRIIHAHEELRPFLSSQGQDIICTLAAPMSRDAKQTTISRQSLLAMACCLRISGVALQ